MPSFRQAFFNLLTSQKLTGQFKPEKQEAMYQQYRDSVGLTQDLKFGAQAFDTHAEKRIKDHAGFKTPIGSNKEDTLEKLLKEDTPDPNKKAIKDELKGILTPQAFYTAAQKTYKESIEAFQQRIKEVPDVSIESLRGMHEVINKRARDALLAQQKTELEALKAKADDLAQKIGTLSGNTDLAAIKNNLIADLEKNHKDQLAEFNKSAQENVTILDKASALERKRLIFTAQLEGWAGQLSSRQKQEMIDELERAREENRKKRGLAPGDQLTGAEINVGENQISAVNPEDLNFIVSATGAKIQHSKGKDGEPGVWTVQLSARILSPFYYFSNKQNPKTEMLTMAQAVRASGFDSITMTINFDDPATQKQRARQAYEAALECGFDPAPLAGQEGKEKPLKGIVLKDGAGKEIDPATLFTPNELRILHEDAAKRREKLKAIVEEPAKKPSPELAQDYRKQINDTRDAIRTKAGQAAVDRAQEDTYDTQVKNSLS
ncbi:MULTISPECIES: hypothetical protein [Legionella]|uniref:hypothetical protein n=1 Tax=Legionella TaxID=445 RepID=UPI00095D3871|nr:MULTISPECIES: hypothetical protein [Legionella]MBN9227385.1 hypothetical protein [Legionella steelei]OJW16191.1 MAG: hypothetical protein BGO44_06835 [Legionella sp. 39-23]